MPEVKINKEKSLTRREEPVLSRLNEMFTPMLPLGRVFGLSPFAMMREFTEEMDRMFQGAPAIDVQQANGNLTVTAELPGLKKEEVKVELSDDALVIEGERKREHKEEREGYYRSERCYGKFYRSIPLPEGAKTDQAKAELSDGVLKVTVPVPEAKKKVREIAVEEGPKTKPATA
jgi:HSP20 family protein